MAFYIISGCKISGQFFAANRFKKAKNRTLFGYNRQDKCRKDRSFPVNSWGTSARTGARAATSYRGLGALIFSYSSVYVADSRKESYTLFTLN